jgi:hypothetical protein
VEGTDAAKMEKLTPNHFHWRLIIFIGTYIRIIKLILKYTSLLVAINYTYWILTLEK